MSTVPPLTPGGPLAGLLGGRRVRPRSRTRGERGCLRPLSTRAADRGRRRHGWPGGRRHGRPHRGRGGRALLPRAARRAPRPPGPFPSTRPCPRGRTCCGWACRWPTRRSGTPRPAAPSCTAWAPRWRRWRSGETQVVVGAPGGRAGLPLPGRDPDAADPGSLRARGGAGGPAGHHRPGAGRHRPPPRRHPGPGQPARGRAHGEHPRARARRPLPALLGRSVGERAGRATRRSLLSEVVDLEAGAEAADPGGERRGRARQHHGGPGPRRHEPRPAISHPSPGASASTRRAERHPGEAAHRGLGGTRWRRQDHGRGRHRRGLRPGAPAHPGGHHRPGAPAGRRPGAARAGRRPHPPGPPRPAGPWGSPTACCGRRASTPPSPFAGWSSRRSPIRRCAGGSSTTPSTARSPPASPARRSTPPRWRCSTFTRAATSTSSCSTPRPPPTPWTSWMRPAASPRRCRARR